MNISHPLRFLLFFCISYSTLIAIHEIKEVRNFHNQFFMTVEQAIFNLFNPNVHIDLNNYMRTPGVPFEPELYDHSFAIFIKSKYKLLQNKQHAQPINLLNANLDNVSIGPLVLFLSLLIATPVVWKRKVLYAITGIFIIYILIALKYSFIFYENIDRLEAIGLWGFLSNSIGGAFRSHEFLLFNVFFIWALISIRSKEYKWFMS